MLVYRRVREMDVSEEKLKNREFMGIPKICFNGENYDKLLGTTICTPTLVVYGGSMGIHQSWGVDGN
jgi:hypothetical protein